MYIKINFISLHKINNMKLKFPKKVQIGSSEIKMVYDKKQEGGWVDLNINEIGIGTRKLAIAPKEVFEVICHEIMETVCMITKTRFVDYGTMSDFKFFMSHKEFEVNMVLFSIAIQNFIE